MGDIPSTEDLGQTTDASMLAQPTTITPPEVIQGLADREEYGVTNLMEFEYGPSVLLSSESDSALESAIVPSLLTLQLMLRIDQAYPKFDMSSQLKTIHGHLCGLVNL